MEKILLFILKIQTVLAQGGSAGSDSGSGVPPIVDPLHGQGLFGIIANITRFLVRDIAPPLVAVLIVIGAFQMILAGGNPEKIQTGKKTILYAVIGFVVVLIAAGVATLIKNIVTGN